MGYLLCGPVGTGKTYLVECLAGEAGVPVVKLKNFRERWVGSSEGNLEKIFRLVRALGRCMVFIDEADQALGRRESGSGDSGLSGRLYSMIAQEMSDTREPRARRLDPRLVAAGPDRGRPEAARARRREGADPADEHARRERAARRRAREALRARARRRRAAAARAAHADAADAGRRRGARREGLPPRAHAEGERARRRSRRASRATRTRCRRTCWRRRCGSRSARRRTSPSCRRPSGARRPRAARHEGASRSYLAAAFNARPFGMPMPPQLVRRRGLRPARRARRPGASG